MIQREHIESILKINGVAPGSPDEQIRSVLLSARYSKDEVDTAIMVLRENVVTNKTRVDGLHKIFRSSEALNSKEISQLLGIEVDITDRIAERNKANTVTGVQFAFVWILSVLAAVLGVLTYMYLHKVGLFHPSVGVNFL